jgi:lysozyme family protein
MIKMPDNRRAKWLQQTLAGLGLYDGKVDGVFGELTFAGILAYFQDSVYLVGLAAQLTRIERNQDTIMRVLLRMETEIIVAYEAELDAAEAAAKANSD